MLEEGVMVLSKSNGKQGDEDRAKRHVVSDASHYGWDSWGRRIGLCWERSKRGRGWSGVDGRERGERGERGLEEGVGEEGGGSGRLRWRAT